MKKRKRGGQPENQNAAKDEHKPNVQMFGQRWTPEEAETFRQYMKSHRLTKKQFLVESINKLLSGV